MLKVTNENYCCTILKVHHLIDLPGLDNLKGVSCFGQLALVSKEIQVGQLVLFFGPQTKLSDDFCSFNDLYRRVEQNKNGGTGFFDKNVVKPLKLRGNVSTSFVCPVTHLSYLGFDTNTLKEGDVFNEISGVEVCTKYVVRTNRERKAGQKQVKKDFRIDTKLMPEHVDTAHYLKHDRNIDDAQNIIVTQKLHSTSARFAHQLCKRRLTWLEKVAKFFGCQVQEWEYDYFAGSRRVIKDINKDNQHFYKNDIWNSELEKIKHLIPKGWQIFGEILGWDGDKELQKNYTYNIPHGETRLYVYRIATVNPDGFSVDLSWDMVIKFCEDNGLNYCPEIYRGPKGKFNSFDYMDKRFYDMGLTNCVPIVKEKWTYEKSQLDLVDEGVVIRTDDDYTPHFYKHKAPIFLLHEGCLVDKGVVDIEDQQSEVEETNENN